MIIFVCEDGAWRCNECDDWAADPVQHPHAVHDVDDRCDITLVHRDDV